MTRNDSILMALDLFQKKYPTLLITQITVNEKPKSYQIIIGYFDQDNYEHNSMIIKGFKK